MILIVIFLLIIFIIVSVVLFFAFAPQIGAKVSGKRLERIRSSPGFSNNIFQNLTTTKLDLSFSSMVRTMYKMAYGEKNKVPAHPIKTARFDIEAFNKLGNGGIAAIAWFGHTSLLIKLHGKVFLTDPVVVGKRASMLSFLGPKRFPYTHSLELEELPRIDAILLSHDHYDHLDYSTIRLIKDRVNKFIVPLGVGAHLEKWGVNPLSISEYDWWEQVGFDENISLTCTPSRHFSGRAITGRNMTLWCSWIISGKLQRIYFGADSGYSPSFSEIGSKYGPFDLSILECGAYSEYWPDIHMMPEETNQAAIDLNSKLLMPIHWGKFSLALHSWKEPIIRLLRSAATTGTSLVTPVIGSSFELTDGFPRDHWWEKEN